MKKKTPDFFTEYLYKLPGMAGLLKSLLHPLPVFDFPFYKKSVPLIV